MRWLAGMALALAMSGCAKEVAFPSYGTVSRFDGVWEGVMPVNGGPCGQNSMLGEVRYGYLIADIYEGGNRKAQVWGPIDNSGKIDANLGSAGLDYGSADLNFDPYYASGVWNRGPCNGWAELYRRPSYGYYYYR